MPSAATRRASTTRCWRASTTLGFVLTPCGPSTVVPTVSMSACKASSRSTHRAARAAAAARGTRGRTGRRVHARTADQQRPGRGRRYGGGFVHGTTSIVESFGSSLHSEPPHQRLRDAAKGESPPHRVNRCVRRGRSILNVAVNVMSRPLVQVSSSLVRDEAESVSSLVLSRSKTRGRRDDDQVLNERVGHCLVSSSSAVCPASVR